MATCLWSKLAPDLIRIRLSSMTPRSPAASACWRTRRCVRSTFSRFHTVVGCTLSSVATGEPPKQKDGSPLKNDTAVLAAVAALNQRVDSMAVQVAEQDRKINELSARVGVVERNLEGQKQEVFDLSELVSDLRDGLCPEVEVEDAEVEDESAWSQDEYTAKYRLLAQIKADDVIESTQIVARQLLGDLIRSAVNTGKISLHSGVELMQAGLIAVGEDLETVHLVVDSCPDLQTKGNDKFAIGVDAIHTAAVRATNLKIVLGGAQVLAVLLGQSIHPDAAIEAESKGVHVILRNQNDASAVF